MNILITRPKEQGLETKKILHEIGFESAVIPMVEIEKNELELKKRKHDFTIITSQNAIRNEEWIKEKPLFIVGSHSATIAKNLGYENIISVSKDANDLAEVVISSCRQKDKLLYLSGEIQAIDITKMLNEAGLQVDKRVVYQSLEVTSLSKKEVSQINHNVDIVLFYSPRTTHIFLNLAKAYGISTANKNCICISKNCAEAASGIPWKKILAAKTPDESGILELLQQINYN